MSVTGTPAAPARPAPARRTAAAPCRRASQLTKNRTLPAAGPDRLSPDLAGRVPRAASPAPDPAAPRPYTFPLSTASRYASAPPRAPLRSIVRVHARRS